ncbi:MAG TPA: hypothetical protein VF178_02145 [Gemmatimonadaceae bacterium]
MDSATSASIARSLLFGALGLFTLWYLSAFAVAWYRRRVADGRPTGPRFIGLAVGFVTNFFDTLGIGSFAPTTSVFRFLKLCLTSTSRAR